MLPLPQLPSQMPELIPELAIGDRNPVHLAGAAQFAFIERKSPSHRFLPNRLEITVDGSDRKFLRDEPLKLRMMTISSRSSLENLLCKEAFSPECHEPN